LGVCDEVARKAGDAKAAAVSGGADSERVGPALYFISDHQGRRGRVAVAQGLDGVCRARRGFPDNSVRLFERIYPLLPDHPDYVARPQVARSQRAIIINSRDDHSPAQTLFHQAIADTEEP